MESSVIYITSHERCHPFDRIQDVNQDSNLKMAVVLFVPLICIFVLATFSGIAKINSGFGAQGRCHRASPLRTQRFPFTRNKGEISVDLWQIVNLLL